MALFDNDPHRLFWNAAFFWNLFAAAACGAGSGGRATEFMGCAGGALPSVRRPALRSRARTGGGQERCRMSIEPWQDNPAVLTAVQREAISQRAVVLRPQTYTRPRNAPRQERSGGQLLLVRVVQRTRVAPAVFGEAYIERLPAVGFLLNQELIHGKFTFHRKKVTPQSVSMSWCGPFYRLDTTTIADLGPTPYDMWELADLGTQLIALFDNDPHRLFWNAAFFWNLFAAAACGAGSSPLPLPDAQIAGQLFGAVLIASSASGSSEAKHAPALPVLDPAFCRRSSAVIVATVADEIPDLSRCCIL